jgi:hypothetical protein
VRLEAKDLNRTANSYDSGCAFLARQNKVMLISTNGAAHVFIFSASLKREDEQKVTLALLI